MPFNLVDRVLVDKVHDITAVSASRKLAAGTRLAVNFTSKQITTSNDFKFLTMLHNGVNWKDSYVKH
jgi:hypothetical protein